MNKPATIISIIIILNALIWGFAQIMSARALQEIGGYQEIKDILMGSASFSLLVIGGGLAGLVNQIKKCSILLKQSRGENDDSPKGPSRRKPAESPRDPEKSPEPKPRKRILDIIDNAR
jgi:hypothetical protein